MASLSRRYEAAMVLSGAGDALGHRNIFLIPNRKIGILDIICLMSRKADQNTRMHLATSEALTKKREEKCDKGDLYKMIAEKYKEFIEDWFFDTTCYNSILYLEPDIANWEVLYRDYFRDFGCGAATRAMCIGLRYPRELDLPDLIAVSIESGRMTHHNPTGYLGSLASALFTAYAIQGKPPREWGAGLISVLHLAKTYIAEQKIYVKENVDIWDYFENNWRTYLTQKKLLDGTRDPKSDKHEAYEEDWFFKKYRFSWPGGPNGHDSLMIAYDAILQSGKNWEELRRRAMSHSGDTKSTGVIAACYYGAMYGYEGVPEENYRCLEFHDRLVKQANLLYDMARGVVCGNEEVSEGNFKNIEHVDKIVKQGRSLPGKENVYRGECEVETDKELAQAPVSCIGPTHEETSCRTANPVSKTVHSCPRSKAQSRSDDRAVREETESTLQKYNMSHRNRGKAIIMNNKEFNEAEIREGTDKDALALDECLSNLGFEVKRYDDQTAKEMRRLLQEAANFNHGHNDCFILAIMSHGRDEYVMGKDASIPIQEIIDLFKGTVSLAGKPKIFFFQACRGNKVDEGIKIDSSTERGSPILPEKIPTMADFLICYSTVPGYVSFRDSLDGSWFIQSLVDVLKKHSRTMDLLTMMTTVNENVARMTSTHSEPSLDKKKQISCVTSTLTKKVYFTDKKKHPQKRGVQRMSDYNIVS